MYGITTCAHVQMIQQQGHTIAQVNTVHMLLYVRKIAHQNFTCWRHQILSGEDFVVQESYISEY